MLGYFQISQLTIVPLGSVDDGWADTPAGLSIIKKSPLSKTIFTFESNCASGSSDISGGSSGSNLTTSPAVNLWLGRTFLALGPRSFYEVGLAADSPAGGGLTLF